MRGNDLRQAKATRLCGATPAKGRARARGSENLSVATAEQGNTVIPTPLATIGNGHLPRAALERAHSELVLELLDHYTWRRLADEAGLRRAPKMALPRNGNDVAQLPECHRKPDVRMVTRPDDLLSESLTAPQFYPRQSPIIFTLEEAKAREIDDPTTTETELFPSNSVLRAKWPTDRPQLFATAGSDGSMAIPNRELGPVTRSKAGADMSSRRTLRIVQFTDTHLYADGEGRLLGQNTRQTLELVLELAHENHRPFDLILLTGDLVHDESPEGYALSSGRLA